MKILMMADTAANPDSGAAGTNVRTAEALRSLGHDVETLWSDSLSHRIAHPNLHYLLELPAEYRAAMLRRMRGTRYDVVQASQPHGFLAAKSLIDRRERTVFVHRTHGLELRVERELAKWHATYAPDERRSWLRRQASRVMADLLARHSRAIARYASGHIVSAGECRQYLNEELGVPLERIALITTAAPHAYVSTPAPAMTRDRQLRLLHVGQYAYFKAPMIVAETINRVAELDDRVSVTWVTPKAAHPNVRALLRGAVRERVTLMDWMPQDRLIDVYDRHGIFLFPSFVEGFGKVFLEAMARGLCVIAADNSGARDVINDGSDGLLVPTGEIGPMTEASLGLLRSPERVQAISRQAAIRAREYSWDRVARETVGFFENLLRTRGSDAARS